MNSWDTEERRTLRASARRFAEAEIVPNLAAWEDAGALPRDLHRKAADATLALMQAAGLNAHIDALGSVIGRMEGADPDAPALLIGSHIDSVVDAGRYDGNLGVVLGIVVIEAMKQQGIVPACPIEIVA